MIDPYMVLGVDKNSPRQEIQNAYRDKVRLLHPDLREGKSLTDKENDELIALNEAWDILRNSERRSEYDAYGFIRTEYRPQETQAEQHFKKDSATGNPGEGAKKSQPSGNPHGAKSRPRSGETYAQQTRAENFSKGRSYSPMNEGSDFSSQYWDVLRRRQETNSDSIKMTREQVALFAVLQSAFMSEKDGSFSVSADGQENSTSLFSVKKEGSTTTLFINNNNFLPEKSEITRNISFVEMTEGEDTTTFKMPKEFDFMLAATFMVMTKEMAAKRKEGRLSQEGEFGLTSQQARELKDLSKLFGVSESDFIRVSAKDFWRDIRDTGPTVKFEGVNGSPEGSFTPGDVGRRS